MPSPLTFFKTLANQKGKSPSSPVSQSGYQIKGKLRKPSIRYPSSQTHTNVQPETKNAGQMIEDDSENDIPYHPSIPEGNGETWRKFPPAYRVETAMTHSSHRPLSQARQSSVPSENPIVSRYYPAAHAVQPQPRDPMPPSRTWSTIPSVRRESTAPRRGYHDGGDAIGDERDDLDTVPQAQSTPLRQTTPSRRSTVRTIGQLPSIHERHLLEYPNPVKQKQVEPPERNVRSAQKSRRQPVPQVAKLKPANPNRNTGFDDGDETSSEPEVYHYIVPSGIEVVFEDEAGTEITRVGSTTITAPDPSRSLQSAPIVVQDEFGRVLYQDDWPPDRGGNSRRTTHHSRHGMSESGQFMPERGQPRNIEGNRHANGVMSSPSSSLSSNSTKLIMIDKGGHQIPITTANLRRERLKEQRQHPVPGTSHHASISNA